MRKILCVICVVTVLLGWSVVVSADPHAGPGTGDDLKSVIVITSLEELREGY